MIVAITGGTGLIGRALVRRHINVGDEVRLLSRRTSISGNLGNRVELVQGDLAGPQPLSARLVDGVDILYHCAGELRDPARMHVLHVRGTQRLVELATDRVGRWVQLSSVGAYGRRRQGAITEETPEAPLGVYERTKTSADQLVRAAAEIGAFPMSMLRPSSVYGPEMRDDTPFAQLVSAIDRGLFWFIGRPGASANLIHVEGVVEALYRCGTVPAAIGRTYNVSDYRPLEAAVATIARTLGCTVPTRRLPEPPVRLAAWLGGWIPGWPLTPTRVTSLTARTTYPIDRIVEELGYAHPISMEDGLQEATRAWRMRRDGQAISRSQQGVQ
jgi:nucleoside-diphosphate-sugar epimerase